MLSRMLAVVISSWLPALGLILPVSAAHRANALVAGIIGTALAALSLADKRARFGAALVGAWVALSPFVIADSTLLEKVLTVTWGVSMFTWLIGPFSEQPSVTWMQPAVVHMSPPDAEVDLPRAA
jgi:hypothetical protein